MRKLPLIATVFLWVCANGAAAQSGQTLFDEIYRPDTILEIQLRCDWDSLLAIRKTEVELEGELLYPRRNGEMVTWDAGISPRGKYRRRICDFPPLKLEFSKKDLRKADLLPFDDLKLVTHCLDNPESEETIIREYLAYRIYQMFSPYACRVQLVRIQYLDEDPSKPGKSHLGMLIEEDRMRAHRFGLQISDTLNLKPSDFPEDMAEVHALFQYLIGNTDWSLLASRNLEMYHDGSSGTFFMVPYDFDFSGLVNAPYAIPNPDYKMANIRQRVYLCTQLPGEAARLKVLAQQKDIIRYIRKSNLLDAEAKADCISYLNSGFRDIKKNQLAVPETK